MLRRTIGWLALVLASAIPAADGAAQGDAQASPSCLYLPMIDRTEIVDTRNILFYMKDRTVYQNALPRACATLEQTKPFLYRVGMNQICDLDMITVLEQWSIGFTPGETCGLGKFRLVNDADIEALKAAAEAARAGAKK
jgi:hypothetical protein